MKEIVFIEDGYRKISVLRNIDTNPRKGIIKHPPLFQDTTIPNEEKMAIYNALFDARIFTRADVFQHKNIITNTLRKLNITQYRSQVLAAYKR